ncbi:MAG: hypothetical protein U0T75_04650 [Chitinophagales bacterium]
MAKSKNKIIKEIEAFKNSHSGDYKDYYIGITKHVGQRLVEVNIDEHVQAGNYIKGDDFYEAEAESREIANEIELEFQAKGMKGKGTSKGKRESRYVYCFKLASKSKYLLTEREYHKVFKNVVKRLMDYKSFEAEK